jgi:hypothetical protein
MSFFRNGGECQRILFTLSASVDLSNNLLNPTVVYDVHVYVAFKLVVPSVWPTRKREIASSVSICHKYEKIALKYIDCTIV